MRWIVRLVILIALAGAAFAGWEALQPKPVAVDIVTVETAPMSVEIEETGQTRVRDIYRISAPVAGRIDRTLLHIGDRVVKGETVVATIHPVDPPFMDTRSRAEAEARVQAAIAAVSLAQAQLEQANAAHDLASRDYKRALRLATSDNIPAAHLDAARIDAALKQAQVDSAQASVRLRESELASARATLIQPGGPDDVAAKDDCCVQIVAPIDGVVLGLSVESENVVPAGAPLAEIGDPSNLEVVVDLLSSDAVRVKAGTRAMLVGWGGDPIPAHLRRVDPAGFVRVSALGIEERRVNAILDPDVEVPALGHGFEVRVRLAVWQNDAVRQVPLTAIFRDGNSWAAFVMRDGLAHQTTLKIGHVNASSAQVLEGLSDGDIVVDFPGDQVSDGVMVTRRVAGG